MVDRRSPGGWRFVLLGCAGLALCGCAGPKRGQSPVGAAQAVKGPFRQDVAWSPDGKWLAYSEYDGREPFDIAGYAVWVAAADGSDRRRVVDQATWVSWSPEGERIAFGAVRAGNWDVYTVDASGGNLRRLTHDPARDQQPAWSPDGKQVAFCSERSGGSDIYVAPVDGGEPRRVTADADKDFNPAWSPDGKSIVFYREKGDGKDQVWVVEAASGAERRITDDELNNTFPSYLPDGGIAYVAGGKGREQAVVVWREGKSRKVSTGRERTFFARWSPDGKSIACITGGWPHSVIRVLNARGGGSRIVVE